MVYYQTVISRNVLMLALLGNTERKRNIVTRQTDTTVLLQKSINTSIKNTSIAKTLDLRAIVFHT